MLADMPKYCNDYLHKTVQYATIFKISGFQQMLKIAISVKIDTTSNSLGVTHCLPGGIKLVVNPCTTLVNP
jgi:hypothetical protein